MPWLRPAVRDTHAPNLSTPHLCQVCHPHQPRVGSDIPPNLGHQLRLAGWRLPAAATSTTRVLRVLQHSPHVLHEEQDLLDRLAALGRDGIGSPRPELLWGVCTAGQGERSSRSHAQGAARAIAVPRALCRCSSPASGPRDAGRAHYPPLPHAPCIPASLHPCIPPMPCAPCIPAALQPCDPPMPCAPCILAALQPCDPPMPCAPCNPAALQTHLGHVLLARRHQEHGRAAHLEAVLPQLQVQEVICTRGNELWRQQHTGLRA